MKSSLRPSDKSLPIKLLELREGVMAHFRPWLHENGLTEQQWRVMRCLADANHVADSQGAALDFAALSEASLIQAASLSRMITLMQDKGWVYRIANTSDKRQVTIELSPEGEALFAQVSQGSEAIYQELETKLGDTFPQLMQCLSEALTKVKA